MEIRISTKQITGHKPHLPKPTPSNRHAFAIRSNVNNEAFDEDRLLERELMDAYVERLAELDLRPTAIYDQSNKPGVVSP